MRISNREGCKLIELEGDSPPLVIAIAGYRYLIEITNPSDAAFTITEFTPDFQVNEVAGGSEW